MSKSEMVSLQINEDMVKPILEKQIQAAIVANIGDPEKLIQKVVATALSQKVNKEGKIDQYDSYNTYDYLEVLTGQAIRKAAKEALGEWLAENQELLKIAVTKELNKPARLKSIVGAFADAAENSFKCDWQFNCDVTFSEIDK
jgi:dsDNA-binding SOS-regulon protein